MAVRQRYRFSAWDWPPAGFPFGGSHGDENDWQASEFIGQAITAIGADTSQVATDTLDRLAIDSRIAAYRDQIKHVRAQQQRLRLDSEYRVPSFAAVKSALDGGLPETIDDLKALVLDALQTVQVYLRQSETTAWSPYWSKNIPQTENTCRNRLVDDLREPLPKAVMAAPEALMPDAKRADIAVTNNGMGLPVEIKGQWHKDVWDAPSTQLIDRYTKDYRANGRGIYIVFWFGKVAGKQLVRHPDGLPPPKSPDELRQMLTDRLAPLERKRVDIVVIDVSSTKKPRQRKART